MRLAALKSGHYTRVPFSRLSRRTLMPFAPNEAYQERPERSDFSGLWALLGYGLAGAAVGLTFFRLWRTPVKRSAQ